MINLKTKFICLKSKRMIKTTKLEPDKSVVFKSPIRGNATLVRTGNSTSSLSFFQSVLHSCSEKYVRLSTEEKINFVESFKKDIISSINRKIWEEISDLAKFSFKKNVNDILFNFYLFLENNPKAKGQSTYRVIKKLVGENEKSLEVYKLIAKTIPFEEVFKKKILASAYSKTENKQISDVCDAIIKETIKFIKNKNVFIETKIIQILFFAIFNEAEEQAFKTFISNLQNVPIDETIVSLVSNHFKRDIYFLNYTNRMPFIHYQTIDKIKKQKSIIIFCFSNGSYEVIGKLLENNRIQREFDFDDPIIQKMYTFLVNPEQISTKFKKLVKYLPQKYKESSNSEEDSEEEEEEESEEESEEEKSEEEEESEEEESEEEESD